MSIAILYGLIVRAPFALPREFSCESRPSADVIVREGPVAPQLAGATLGGPGWAASPGQFLLDGGPRIGLFHAQGPTTVIWARPPKADLPMVAFAFVHTVMAAVMRHRGSLVLHANVVAGPHSATAFCGESGAGKSTTAAAMHSAGHLPICDDVAALTNHLDGEVRVETGLEQVRLLPESVAAFGFSDPGADVPLMRGKQVWDFQGSRVRESHPLKALYLLERCDTPAVSFTEISGIAMFEALQRCNYGPNLPGDTPPSFALQAQLVRDARMWRVKRPAGRWSVDEVVAGILQREAEGPSNGKDVRATLSGVPTEQ